MTTSREAALTALFNLLVGSLQTSFTANMSSGSAVLTGIASTAKMFQGLPVFGPNVPPLASIRTVDSSSQVTLDQPATGDASAAALTTGFQTVGRRRVHWSKLTAQPAMFLTCGDDDYADRPRGTPRKLTMNCEIWVYSRAGENPDAIPVSALNNIIDAIEVALEPPAALSILTQNVQNLGGLVDRVWITGTAEKAPGDDNSQGQAVARIPVKILFP